MDPVTLVVTALATGASTAVSETVGQLSESVGQALADAYGRLKDLVRRRLVQRRHDPDVMAFDGTEPEDWRARLEGRLAPADVDDELRAAAEEVLAVGDPAGYRAGKYAVDVRGAKGVQVGDGNVQHNTFG